MTRIREEEEDVVISLSFVMVKKMEKWSGIYTQTGSAPKSTTSRGSSLTHAYHVWSTSVTEM